MNLSIGTDIEQVSRLRHLWISKPSVLKKMFYQSEWDYFIAKNQSFQSLTGIWCAKEAVVKAINRIERLEIKKVEIINMPNAAPQVKFHNLSDGSPLKTIDLSLSIAHCRDYSIATDICW